VWNLDRLGRNTQHVLVLAVLAEHTSRGIGFHSITKGLHTDGPMGRWADGMHTIMPPSPSLNATR
jgi:DNA invertase Pin-like site-specific DNA recombinase